jgi:hypothetical protein
MSHVGYRRRIVIEKENVRIIMYEGMPGKEQKPRPFTLERNVYIPMEFTSASYGSRWAVYLDSRGVRGILYHTNRHVNN